MAFVEAKAMMGSGCVGAEEASIALNKFEV